MEYYGNNDWRDYLAHYGVKGMKWRNHKYVKKIGDFYDYHITGQGYVDEGRKHQLAGNAALKRYRQSSEGSYKAKKHLAEAYKHGTAYQKNASDWRKKSLAGIATTTAQKVKKNASLAPYYGVYGAYKLRDKVKSKVAKITSPNILNSKHTEATRKALDQYLAQNTNKSSKKTSTTSSKVESAKSSKSKKTSGAKSNKPLKRKKKVVSNGTGVQRKEIAKKRVSKVLSKIKGKVGL